MNLKDIAITLTNLFGASAKPETQVATQILAPSINVIARAIATHGVSLITDAAVAAGAAALNAKATGSSNSDSGQAAIDAAEKTALGAAVKLGGDVLHAIAASAVTNAQSQQQSPQNDSPKP